MFFSWRFIGFLLFASAIFVSHGWADDYYKNAPPCVMADGGPERGHAFQTNLGDSIDVADTKIFGDQNVAQLPLVCADKYWVFRSKAPELRFFDTTTMKINEDISFVANVRSAPIYYKGLLYIGHDGYKIYGNELKKPGLVSYDLETKEEKYIYRGHNQGVYLIYNDIAYVIAYTLNEKRDRRRNILTAVRLSDNKVLWTREFAEQKYVLVPKIVTDGKYIYLHDRVRDDMRALDLKNGQEKWHVPVASSSDYMYLGQQTVFLKMLKHLDLFDKETGHFLRRYETRWEVFAKKDDIFILMKKNGSITAYSEKTGEMLWNDHHLAKFLPDIKYWVENPLYGEPPSPEDDYSKLSGSEFFIVDDELWIFQQARDGKGFLLRVDVSTGTFISIKNIDNLDILGDEYVNPVLNKSTLIYPTGAFPYWDLKLVKFKAG